MAKLRRMPDPRPPDWEARAQALDIRRSWIVEAPAGSGKTGLLIQRLLKLLGDESVQEPEQVLAITFTRDATAEIRDRVLQQLQAAGRNAPVRPRDEFAAATRQLAERVLERDADRKDGCKWDLVRSPQRLNIRTIDAVCRRIVSMVPLLAGGSGQYEAVDDASRLYQTAARATLLRLGSGDAMLDRALREVLLHRDGRLADVERLLAEMLGLRDQWGDLVPLERDQLTDAVLDGEVLPRLQHALSAVVHQTLDRAATRFNGPLLAECVQLAAQLAACPAENGGDNPYRPLADGVVPGTEGADALARWQALASLLLTRQGSLRKPSGVRINSFGVIPERSLVQRIKQLITDAAQDIPADELAAIQDLPEAIYPQEQWQVAKALFRVLRHAMAELQGVFAAERQCDFVEISLRARAALRAEHGVADLEMALGDRWQHLLVDEMQDTSTSQYELLERLTQSWDGSSQTVFLVGDPKQSIYIFRQARVERFLDTMRRGRLGELPLGALRLTANFRSQAGLVQAFNQDFSNLFPQEADAAPGEVAFTRADAVRSLAPDANHAVWHVDEMPRVARAEVAKEREALQQSHAVEIRALVQQWRERPLPPGRSQPWRIAVLVRQRNHLHEVMQALRQDEGNGAIPYRALKIDPLAERQEVLDLRALTRALLHPADRIAWAGLLRAPWCGLALADLQMLMGEDASATACVLTLMRERGHLLSDDGATALQRVWKVMTQANRMRSRLPVATWVERTWRSLGGDLWLQADELANALAYLDLLRTAEREGQLDLQLLESQLEKLYAEQSEAPGAVELLTIHGAKGLEWDVVIAPHLHRISQPDRSRLLTWGEIEFKEDNAHHVLLAPIAGKGRSAQRLAIWLGKMHREREAAERLRLFYVLCTRAREELHLYGTVQTTQEGMLSARYGSLLRAAWSAAEVRRQQWQAVTMAPAPPLNLAAAADALPARELQRLPADIHPVAERAQRRVVLPAPAAAPAGEPHFTRPEGSLAARATGNAIHGLLEAITLRVQQGAALDAIAAELDQWTDRIRTVLRSEGVPPRSLAEETQRTLAGLQNTLADADGRWLLTQQRDAASEHALVTWAAQRSSVRLDRIFRAGAEPGSADGDCLWIVDYKTRAYTGNDVETFLQEERAKYAGQMAQYARVFGQETHAGRVRLGLYFPALPRLVWWTAVPD
ncbi:MAG: UvrD-helicase domain-containing protein [Acidobacteriota bacterium]|nr:UvrD-helicase domain-containing protein [Acidobacteriota bacterium]